MKDAAKSPPLGTTRALFFDAPRRVSIRDVALHAKEDGVLVHGLASAISQGTEMLLYRGEGPEPFDPSLEVSAGGTYPCRYGYAWVGERDDDGQRVFALAPHGDAHRLAPREMRPLRSDIPIARATLAANLETAITCAWDAQAAFGERVVVLGGGVVGLLSAWVLAKSGCHVTLVDPRRARRECAALLGAHAVEIALPSLETSADVVIEATGDPRALDAAIACAAESARIVVASFYGRRRAPVDLGDAFHFRRLSLISSVVSTIPPHLSSRWSSDRRFDVVQDLLADQKLDALFAPAVPFEQAPNVYALLDRAGDESLPCHVLAYRR